MSYASGSGVLLLLSGFLSIHYVYSFKTHLTIDVENHSTDRTEHKSSFWCLMFSGGFSGDLQGPEFNNIQVILIYYIMLYLGSELF